MDPETDKLEPVKPLEPEVLEPEVSIRGSEHSRSVLVRTRLEMHRGPLPHPSILQGYKDIQFDAPERLLAEMEKFGQCNRDLARIETESACEVAKIDSASNREVARMDAQAAFWRGIIAQICIFLVVVAFLVAIVWLALAGKETIAGILAGTTFVGVIAAIVQTKIGQPASRANTESDHRPARNQSQEEANS